MFHIAPRRRINRSATNESRHRPSRGANHQIGDAGLAATLPSTIRKDDSTIKVIDSMANPTGKQLLHSSVQLFRQNRKIIWLPIWSLIATLAVLAAIGTPLRVLSGVPRGPWTILVLLPAVIGSSFVSLLFSVALAFAAAEQIEGRQVDISQALRYAWTKRSMILQWAVFSGIVGLVINAIERRIGFLAKFTAMLSSLAWSVAVYFVIPILAFENIGPIDSIRRSSRLMRTTFGPVLRSALRFGFLFGPALVGGFSMILIGGFVATGAPALGLTLLALGIVAILAIGAYASAVATFLRTVLYRFSTGQSVPDFGIDYAKTFERRPKSRFHR